MQIFFHIGRIKTGTTSIQNFLASNQESLIKNGIYYGDYAQNWGGVPPAHFNIFYPFLKLLLHRLEFSYIANKKFPAAQDFFFVVDKIITNAKKNKCQRIIISCENFSQICTFIKAYTGTSLSIETVRDAVQQIFSELEERFNVESHFILYLREQCSFLISDYNQAVKGGNFWGTFDDYVLGKLYNQDMDDLALIKIFSSEEERFRVVSFEQTAYELNKNLLSFINKDINIDYFINIKKKYNTSLSLDILNFRLFLKEKLPKKAPSGIFYEFIFEKFQEVYAEKYKSKLIPRQQTIQAIQNTYKEQNRIIKEKYFSHLEGDLYKQYTIPHNTNKLIPVSEVMADFINFLFKTKLS